MTIGDEGQAAERLAGSFVTANAFPLLRVTPAIGRHFSEEDDRPARRPSSFSRTPSGANATARTAR